MALLTDFQAEVQRMINQGNKVNEILLFTSLCNVIKQHYYCDVTHKKIVGYQNQSGSNVRCEISDLFMIFVGRNNIRYTFLQAKKEKVTSRNTMTVSKVQWELLAGRPIIDPCNTHFSRTILSGAILDSAGSYGDFYKDQQKQWDMKYFIANTASPKPRKTSTLIIHAHNLLNDLNNGFYETEMVDSLRWFEYEIRNEYIGTPILPLGSDVDFDDAESCRRGLERLQYGDDRNVLVILRYLNHYLNDRKRRDDDIVLSRRVGNFCHTIHNNYNANEQEDEQIVNFAVINCDR